ncbi:MAG: GPH family glycoside/pentoside/hexuronide:cation symporter [Gammaproteobacteria bacterium]|jgi:GPH family glycoside/pentoside/hexuronide:cation symporter
MSEMTESTNFGAKHVMPPTTWKTKFFYGFGSVAYGVKDNGFAYLLLFYYSQVLGLSAQLAGLGMLIAMISDALTDPIVGRVSDNFHSKWGRRHPFMYASAIPIAISYYFLWNPPSDLSQIQLFAYFVTLAVIVRTCITLYEIPSSALIAELTDDYDERTSFMGFRHFFGWWGGLSMSVLAYTVFLVATDDQERGVLVAEGYQGYSIAASAVMVFAVMVSCLGTHKYIPYLRKPPEKKPFSLARTVDEMKETLLEPAFLTLFVAGFFAAMAGGLTTSMDIYLNTYFWGLDSSQLGTMSMGYFLSALLALMLAIQIGKRFNKKHGAIMIGIIAAVIAPLPYILHFLDMFPAKGSDQLMVALMTIRVIDVALIIASGILVGSMIADVVEQSELKTGRRSEGVFFAARNFIAKSVTGVGIILTTTLLTVIEFPNGADPADVPVALSNDLAIFYAPLSFAVYMISILVLFGYKISRAKHEENVRILAEEGLNA